MRGLVWFRADLRVRDHTALDRACAAATEGVVGVFVVCPRQWREEHDWSDAKMDFILRGLAELRDELWKLHIPLKILEVEEFGGVPEALDRLAASCGCTALFYNREYEVNETARDAAVMQRFLRAGRAVHACTDQVILPPGDVITKSGGWYTVFSPFKRRWRERYGEGHRKTAVGRPGKQAEAGLEPDKLPSAVCGFDREAPAVRPDLWPAGEREAEKRLQRFLERRAGSYHDARNTPSEDGTSGLSAYLTMGMISPRRCFELALEANGGRLEGGAEGLVAWMDELIWREFYKHVLVGFPRVSRHAAFRRDIDRVTWREDGEAFEAWKSGRTGFPIVDAGMRQLNETGWMHNRLRMITAMFLTKDLLIDWRLGERYFMRTLIDGDLASNNGGWQWSASTGTDAQPYFRIFNPTTQGQRFDPDGAYIRRYVPELADLEGKAVHEPHRTGLFDRGELDYPAPMVDHKAARERALKAFKAAATG